MANVIINDTNLVNIANAIREKNGLTDTYKPSEMAGAILAIQGGGGGGDFEWPTTLDMDTSPNYQGSFDWLWLQCKSPIRIHVGASAQNAFSNSTIEDASNITIYLDANGTGTHNYCLAENKAMKKLPKVHFKQGLTSNNNTYFFQNCYQLAEIDENIFMQKTLADGVFTPTGTLAISNQCRLNYMFSGCYSLRELPILHDGTQRAGYNNYGYQNLFTYCYSLNKITNIPVLSYAYSSNQFSSAFAYCCRVNKITFETHADGTPYTANWSKQTIDLSSYVGYTNSASRITDYNSGLDASTLINRLDQWNERKDNPDAWCLCDSGEWSLYNHDSAVETIKSLPDCSAGSGNTIVFLGNSAISTGNPISKLTEEEIAVATAKGWTVTLV